MASLSCSSRTSCFTGKQGLYAPKQVTVRGATGCVMRKKGIHPEWYPEAKVYCNGVEVMTVGGTKQSYNVDIYSGNHPFYQGVQNNLILDEGQLNKFKKRFAGLDELSTVETAKVSAGQKK